MSIIGWALAAFLFLSPIIVTGLIVWEHEQPIYSLAEEEENDIVIGGGDTSWSIDPE
jgi:hypothetical protein